MSDKNTGQIFGRKPCNMRGYIIMHENNAFFGMPNSSFCTTGQGASSGSQYTAYILTPSETLNGPNQLITNDRRPKHNTATQLLLPDLLRFLQNHSLFHPLGSSRVARHSSVNMPSSFATLIICSCHPLSLQDIL